jgi:hypothetical protein
MSREGRYFARSQEGGAVMSREGRYFARSQEGGAIRIVCAFAVSGFNQIKSHKKTTEAAPDIANRVIHNYTIMEKVDGTQRLILRI